MTREEFAAVLGREPSATDQMPGTYRYRATKGAPIQAVRISFDGATWHVLLNGAVQPGSGALDPSDIPFILWRGPFWSITEAEYMAILREYQDAGRGTPLRTPDQPVNLRESEPL